MKTQFSRRSALAKLGGALAGLLTLSVARTAKAAVQKVFVSYQRAQGLRPDQA